MSKDNWIYIVYGYPLPHADPDDELEVWEKIHATIHETGCLVIDLDDNHVCFVVDHFPAEAEAYNTVPSQDYYAATIQEIGKALAPYGISSDINDWGLFVYVSDEVLSPSNA